MDADYSQIELRVLASMSEMKSIKLPYGDRYSCGYGCKEFISCAAWWGWHLNLEETQGCKLQVVYGISAFGLSEDLSISRKEGAWLYQQLFLKSYEGVKKFLDKLGWLITRKKTYKDYVGRIRYTWDKESSNFMTRSFGDRVAMNSPVQGKCSWYYEDCYDKGGWEAQ